MAKEFLAVIEFPTIGGDPLDASHNQFAFAAPDSITASQAADGAHDALDAFYNGAGITNPISYYLSPVMSRVADAAVIRLYELTGHLDGSAHGPPVAMRTMTLGAAAAGQLGFPEGVSIALSYNSAYGTDAEFGVGTRPRARDRGRVYLGPVNAATFASDGTTHRTSVSAPCRADIAHRASILQLNGYPSSGDQIRWHVWSRAGAAVKAVVNGWIDDRYDYQRRREDQGLVRTTW